MFVRLTFIKFSPENIKEAKRIYNEEVVPIVLKQKGNVNIMLLEPNEQSDDYISITEWKTKADAEAYESSGTYHEMVAKLESFFTKQPVLKTFTAEKALVPST